MALTTAVTIDTRGDARQVRQQAAIAALTGLAEGLKDIMFAPENSPGLPEERKN